MLVSMLQGQWKETGPYGGSADFIRVNAKQQGRLLAGARQGLLFQSANSGESWTPLAFPGQLRGTLSALEIDPQNPAVFYVGVKDDNQASGVYRTTDSGASWTLLLKGQAVWSLAMWPGDSQIIAAGTEQGVYRSADGGDHWDKISPDSYGDLHPVVSLAFHPTDKNRLYAGTTHLPWETADGGATWRSIHSGMIDDSDVFSIQVDQAHPESVFASACSGVYRSSQGGAEWKRLPTPRGAFRVYFVALDPRHAGVVFAGASLGLLKSGDSGATWRKVSAHAVRSIAFDPWQENRTYFASTNGGLLVSTDAGDTLVESNRGFSNRNFTNLTGAGGSLYASSVFDSSTGGLFRSDDLGASWKRVGNGELAAGKDRILLIAAAPGNHEVLLAAGYRTLHKSATGGRTWTLVRTPEPGRGVTALIVLSGKQPPFLAAAASGIFRSLDAGLTWKRALPLTGARVQSFQSSGESVVAAMTDRQGFVSRDAGAAWTQCGEIQGATWYGLAMDQKPGTTALAATSHGLFRSADGCSSWSPALDGLAAGTVSVVLANPRKAGEFYATQYGRILRSVDGGVHWAPLHPEDSDVYASAVVILPAKPERLFALLPRRGVLSTLTVPETHE
jgi:Uncharacterized protein related to plant photosystem II stability/assembly factor